MFGIWDWGGLFWTSAQVKMCWKRGAPGRGGSGSPFLACTNTFCPGPLLIPVISGVSISFLDAGMSEDAGGSPLETAKYLEIHFYCLLAKVIFLCFNDKLALCGIKLLEFWRQNVVHWTLGFAVCLVKGLFRNAGRFEGSIPQCSCFFTHIPWEEQSTLGSVP